MAERRVWSAVLRADADARSETCAQYLRRTLVRAAPLLALLPSSIANRSFAHPSAQSSSRSAMQ